MAVCRGGIAFWVGCILNHGSRQPIKKHHWSLIQAVDWQWIGQTHSLCSASWALVPPNSLRYQNIKQPVLSNPFHHESHPHKTDGSEVEWEDSVSVCVLGPKESNGQHILVEIPLFEQTKIGDLLPLGTSKPVDFLFPLTTVDGCREDDITVRMKIDSLEQNGAEFEKREHGSFRSLFETEGCPAPFMHGSMFYCFHSLGTEPLPGCCGIKAKHGIGLWYEPLDPSLLLPNSLCTHAKNPDGDHNARETEGEEELALIYERLRIELPSFFMKSHDYTMYSNDVEFINGLFNTKTRGRLVYQLTLSLWRLLCLCYYAEARLEVLKLTKHTEDRTIRARWRIKGLPFHTLILRFYRKDKSRLYRSYDAFSTFYIGHDGLIYCHRVEKVMQAQPPILPRVTSLLTGALVALEVQEHRPALNLLPLFLSAFRQGRN